MEAEEKGLKTRVKESLAKRRENVINGNINCIPFPFKRFRDDIPGIEKGRYYIVTGATKSGKTQFASYVFLYYPILYAYSHPDQLRVRYMYYAQEETPEQVMTKFMSFLLYTLSKGKYRISPEYLRSTNKDRPVPEEVLDVLNSEKFDKILSFFEDRVIFCNGSNPTGVWKSCRKYAEEHGTIHTKTVLYTDEFGQQQTNTEAFDWYEPDDKEEYRFIFYDHMSLTNTEKGQNLREAMAKLSEYFVALRNRYQYIAVNIQQQAMFETIDAYKMDMLKPSITNLADNKATARDCDVCLSMFSPYKYGLPSWSVGNETYDITVLKDNIRFMECLLNRHGPSNGVMPLYFDGACNYFEQMPKASEADKMAPVINRIGSIRKNNTGIMFLRLTNTITNQMAKVELPTKRSAVKNYNPRLLVLFGKPKSGKSTLMASLDDNLIVDLEDGYRALSVMAVQARRYQDLNDIVSALKEKMAETGKYPYKYITIDNVSRLEEFAVPYARLLYQKTAMGKDWGFLKDATGKIVVDPKTGIKKQDPNADVRTLPNGSGYLYMRQAIKKLIDMFRPYSEHLILVAHVKDKQIKVDGEEMSEMAVDLAGKTGDIICGEADAVGYIYREGKKTIISFEGGDNTIKEARPLHLRGKKIVVAESDDNNSITVDMSKVFIPEE